MVEAPGCSPLGVLSGGRGDALVDSLLRALASIRPYALAHLAADWGYKRGKGGLGSGALELVYDPQITPRADTLTALAGALALASALSCAYKHPPADQGFCVGSFACWHVSMHVFLVAHGPTLSGRTT